MIILAFIFAQFTQLPDYYDFSLLQGNVHSLKYLTTCPGFLDRVFLLQESSFSCNLTFLLCQVLIQVYFCSLQVLFTPGAAGSILGFLLKTLMVTSIPEKSTKKKKYIAI